jgi:chemotaxis protein MotB
MDAKRWLREPMADMRNPRYLSADNQKQDRWLISYVDIVTILLILFVALAAQGMQHAAARPVPEQIKALAPANPVSATLLEARSRLQKLGVDTQLEQRGLVISLPQAVLFDSGQDTINPDALPMISRIADVLRDVPNKVALVGHADPTPIHKRFRNNWELSAARSLRLLDFLTGRYGISEARLSVASQGAYSPKGPNDTENGRAANRRVEIVILND